MECEICKSEINIFDWLLSPKGRKMCSDCREKYKEIEIGEKARFLGRIERRLDEIRETPRWQD